MNTEAGYVLVVDDNELNRDMLSRRLLRHIPVIMISAIGEVESVVRCIEMGPRIICPSPLIPFYSKRGAASAWKRSGCALWPTGSMV